MIKFSVNKLIIFLLLSFTFSDSYIDLKKNITSLLNTTDLIYFNDNVLVSTSGGLYSITNSLLNIDNNSDNTFMKANNDKLYIGSSFPGRLSLFDNDLNIESIIQYPDFDEILDIFFSDNYIFAIGTLNQNNILIQYSINELNEIQYLNYFDTFPVLFETINDLYIFNENLYLATSNGLLSINYSSDILSLSNLWDVNLVDLNISSIIEHESNLYFSYDNEIIDINSNELLSFPNQELVKSMEIQSDKLIVITNMDVYSYYFSSNTIESHMILNDYNSSVVSYLELNNIYYYGIENKGVLIYNNMLDKWDSYIPNTIYKNQFDALALLNNGGLFGIVNHKDTEGQSGGFVCKNPIILGQGISEVSNFYSYNGYNMNKYPLSSGDFKANIINYWSGDNTIHSALLSNNKIIFSNSGVYPESWLGYYNQLANDYLFELSDETSYGGVIQFGYNSFDNSIVLDNCYSLENNILGGNNGIFNSEWTDGFMTINHIISDDFDNIWIANPYSELNNNTIAVKYDNEWSHIQDNNAGYIPKEISLDKNNNIWISYLFSEKMNDSSPYSPGGIRMVEFNDINNETDDVWHINWLDELQNLNIWSLVISTDSYGNEILWVMTDYGIMGYILDVSYTYSGNIIVNFTKIQDQYYFQGLNYSEGCKLRLDNNKNIWITTKSDGIRILKNNGALYDNNIGEITVSNHGILSDIIYDVVFDEYGNAYIATEKGISILETSFNERVNNNSIGVSPNPFIIGENTELILSNIPNDAIVKIINLNGYILKTFNMKNYNRTITWDGKTDDGKKIPSGVYLLTSYEKGYGSKITKIAIINK